MKSPPLKAVILAGGAGTRLWPASRKRTPKQLLPLLGRKSLLQLSWDRLMGLCRTRDVYVCAPEAHRRLIRKALPKLAAGRFIGEPEGRDTAAAIGFAAAVLHAADPQAVMAVVTADHVIEPKGEFRRAFRAAARLAVGVPDALVLFGVQPRFAHTGLGYIHRGRRIAGSDPPAFQLRRFKEKPDAATARRYVAAGTYYWNSGMFVWRAETILRRIGEFHKPLGAALKRFAPDAGTPRQRAAMRRLYPKLPRISIDYAVLEKAPQVLVVELPCRWHDVGSFPVLGEVLETDADGNVVLGGPTVGIESSGNVILSRPGHLIATLGAEDLVIVHTADATLVCPRSEAMRLKELVAELNARKLERYL
jgi:mannose-1-phosphate guanylyltransferase